MDKVRIGMVGVGNIARLHAHGYGNLDNAEIFGLCDVNAALLQQRKSEWDASRTYSSYEEMLADPDIDAVDIITPHHLHRDMAIAAIEAGKHVSLQKPMATTMAECRDIIEATKRSDKVFRNFENFQYYPPLVKAKELLDSGAIGEPVSLRMKAITGTKPGWEIPVERWSWRFDPEKGGGGRMVMDYGSHLFAIALYFMGAAEKVFAWISHREIQNGWIIDNPAMIQWKFKGGERYGSFEITGSDELLVQSKYVPEDEWFELTGTKGFIWVNRCSSMLLDKPPVEMYRDGVVTSFSNLETDWSVSFVEGCRDFVDAIAKGGTPRLTAEAGADVIRFCRAVEQSAREKREVYLDDDVE